ncbi:MAG TPA: ROK family protein [Aggregatilinea sp.]|uniref:ROK family protein n=1 Tax=Aggregatilinea sp. TaxID=2806333 RepID=UPI002CE5EF5F|nr:ROK family protein [Aggregatilinea sp.]HML20597.1 ROK family protein [Aggregatilinea sp.]
MNLLAIDFGGTRTRAAWFSHGVNLIQRDETLSQVDQPAQQVLDRMIEVARKVIPAGEHVDAIGISAPGPLDAARGVIIQAKTLPDWYDVPLSRIISEAFGHVPVFMQNDANLAALAEYHLGAAQGADPTIYLTVSTGIGGGAVIGGTLFTGSRGLAIEPGHMRFPQADGRILRWEELSSGTGIGRLARERLAGSDALSSLRVLDCVDGKAVGKAAQAGDALALDVIQTSAYYFGLGLVNLIHLFNPQAIVLGGSVIQLGDLFLDPAKRIIEQELLDPRFNSDDLIRVAQLGDSVCLYGAALYARWKMESAL